MKALKKAVVSLFFFSTPFIYVFTHYETSLLELACVADKLNPGIGTYECCRQASKDERFSETGREINKTPV